MIKVSILIPTMNRSDFLIRQLQYYASVNSLHPIYIGDASTNDHIEKIKRAIDDLKTIKIHYYHWPTLNDRETISKLGNIAKEKFCALTGDDDFLIPNSLTKCADFLERNIEYRTAQGKGIVLSLENDGVYGNLKDVSPYWLQKNDRTETSARERLFNFSKNYWVPQFSVHRTEEFCNDSKFYAIIKDRSFGELLHSFIFIANGKSKTIDCLYLIRQVHSRRFSLPDTYDWITSENWYSSYNIFSNILTKVLVDKDGVDEDIAKSTVKQAFWTYLKDCINIKYYINYGNLSKDNIMGNITNIIKKIPYSRNARDILVYLTQSSNKISKLSLLSKISPYHNDFIPVYMAITKSNKKRII